MTHDDDPRLETNPSAPPAPGRPEQRIPEQRWETEGGYVREAGRHETTSPSPARQALVHIT
ncbi:hypothetical protein [Actinophytocola glycyrrhizae]|uniref:Uncharacterized protein n=1 Tax=Actinophytocola glycyrrhizae TaxID=2044873 RepID=A0ABV9S835_9PSEU